MERKVGPPLLCARLESWLEMRTLGDVFSSHDTPQTASLA